MATHIPIQSARFRESGSETWLPAQIPGCVQTDLLAQGLIPDPFVADNELRVQWITDRDWEYEVVFEASAALLAEERVCLVCDGVDTIAEVSFNGQLQLPVEADLGNGIHAIADEAHPLLRQQRRRRLENDLVFPVAVGDPLHPQLIIGHKRIGNQPLRQQIGLHATRDLRRQPGLAARFSKTRTLDRNMSSHGPPKNSRPQRIGFDEVYQLRNVGKTQTSNCVGAAVVNRQPTGIAIAQRRAGESHVGHIADALVERLRR